RRLEPPPRAPQSGQVRQHLDEAQDRDFLHGNQRAHAGGAHLGAREAEEIARAARLERLRHARAVPVSARLPGEKQNAEGHGLAHLRQRSDRRRSASRTRSATRTARAPSSPVAARTSPAASSPRTAARKASSWRVSGSPARAGSERRHTRFPQSGGEAGRPPPTASASAPDATTSAMAWRAGSALSALPSPRAGARDAPSCDTRVVLR